MKSVRVDNFNFRFQKHQQNVFQYGLKYISEKFWETFEILGKKTSIVSARSDYFSIN